MNKIVRTIQEENAERSETSAAAFTAASARSPVRRNLSFLSLKSAVNGYPDTGESGDAYDIEAVRDH